MFDRLEFILALIAIFWLAVSMVVGALLGILLDRWLLS